MAFMKPYYTREPFHVGDTDAGERIAIPAEVYGTLDRFSEETGAVRDLETVTGSYWCRLSAPGYMDATEWDGPHASLTAAKREIESMYDVDPDTGENLYDNSDGAW